MARAISFGVIGCGHIAQRHLKHIIDHPCGKVGALYDTDAAVLGSAAEKYKVEGSEDFEQFKNADIDVVCVCTPNGTHARITNELLKAGKHVLVEKPMALNTADAGKMIETAREHNRSLFVVKQNRYNPPITALKNVIDSGKAGKIHMVNVNCYWNRNEAYYRNSTWKGTKKMDGGTLFTQFSHFVDILYYLFGDVKNINGKVGNYGHKDLTEFEDTGSFNFEFLNGAIGSLDFTTCAFNNNMEGSVTVFAENATFKVGGKYLNTIDYQETAGFDIKHLPQSAPANSYGYYKGSMSNHDKVIDNVIKTLKGEADIMTAGEDGLKVVELIENFYKAADQS